MVVKFGREEYEEEAMTVKELKKILLENHPELSSTSNFNIAKLDNELYIVRLKNHIRNGCIILFVTIKIITYQI